MSRHMTSRRQWLSGAAACIAAWPLPGSAQLPTPTADDVKAAYIHKFAGYVDWPASAFAASDAPFVLGVAGSDRVFEKLSRIVPGRTVQGRPMQVRRLGKPDASLDIHMVFVGRDAWQDLSAWAGAAKGRPIVLVTDAPGGLERGAHLAFVQSDERLRFEASLPAADTAGLKLSSRLLTVAERVIGVAP